MPSLEAVKASYARYRGSVFSESWASAWGGTTLQWYGSILPRIHAFTPATTTLEIGCGPGRLSSFLKQISSKLVVADSDPSMLAECRYSLKSFGGDVVYLLTDGKSLSDIKPGSVDFVFSFFSLIHADHDTMQHLIQCVAGVLSPDGVAFIHHSNAGATHNATKAMVRSSCDPSVDAAAIREITIASGLHCRSQEEVNWTNKRFLTDCFSVITRPRSRHAMPYRSLKNYRFSEEIEILGQSAMLYSPLARVRQYE